MNPPSRGAEGEIENGERKASRARQRVALAWPPLISLNLRAPSGLCTAFFSGCRRETAERETFCELPVWRVTRR